MAWVSREKRRKNSVIKDMVAEGRPPGGRTDSSLASRSADAVFRAMEAGSAFRAESAAADLGVPVSDMSNIKITDLKDNMKPGEIAAKIAMTPMAQNMQAQARNMSFGGGGGSAFAGGGTIINGSHVGTLVGPNAGRHGSSMQNLVKGAHTGETARIVSQGRKG